MKRRITKAQKRTIAVTEFMLERGTDITPWLLECLYDEGLFELFCEKYTEKKLVFGFPADVIARFVITCCSTPKAHTVLTRAASRRHAQ